MATYNAIVIGVSAGGMHALSTILTVLPVDFSVPVIIVQHRNSDLDLVLEEILNKKCKIDIVEASPNEKIMPGKVYIAPGGYHLMIEQENTFSLSIDAPINFSIPSIDVLFDSAADVYQDKLIGIILTGSNVDGSQGLKTIRARGGLSVVQDPETADTKFMPESAINLAGADHILALEDIGPFLMEINCVG